MKDLITTMAAITILMVFVMQFAANQVTFGRILAADKVVENFEGVIKENPSVSSQEIENLKLNIAECLGCEPAQVTVDDAEEGRIDINAVIGGVIACGKFLGISDGENTVLYRSSVLI